MSAENLEDPLGALPDDIPELHDCCEPQEKEVMIEGYTLIKKRQHIPSHKITYLEWGDPNNENIVVCAHGLTRNAHDFDILASKLSKDFRVISINYPGRDTSDYFVNGKHYNYDTYFADTEYFLKQLDIKNPIWIGTSMGGIIGMYHASKFKALILNDIGPIITMEALSGIKKYTATYPSYDTLREARTHLETIYASIGISGDALWERLTKHSFVQDREKFRMNYDRRITDMMVVPKADIDIRIIWNQIPCSILVIHGEISPILTKETLEKMMSSKKLDAITLEGIGHAPSLMIDEQIQKITNWISQLAQDSKVANKETTGYGVLAKDLLGMVYTKLRSFLGN